MLRWDLTHLRHNRYRLVGAGCLNRAKVVTNCGVNGSLRRSRQFLPLGIFVGAALVGGPFLIRWPAVISAVAAGAFGRPNGGVGRQYL